MKNLLLTIMLMVPLVAVAADETIMFEIGIGFGASDKVTKTKEQLANTYNNKFCYHRPQGRMVFGAIRYRYDDAEVHVARWFNDADTARCNRDSWAVGLGYVIDTQTGSGADSMDDYYASWTPGIAYTWGGNKDFNVQDNTNTNWRLKDNWQMYNRVAVGTPLYNRATTPDDGNDINVEIAVARYGMITKDYERKGENFITIGFGYRDYDVASDGDRGLTPPVEINSFDIVIEDHTTSADSSAAVDITGSNIGANDEPVIIPDGE